VKAVEMRKVALCGERIHQVTQRCQIHSRKQMYWRCNSSCPKADVGYIIHVLVSGMGTYSNDARRRHPHRAGQISVNESSVSNNLLLLGGKRKGRALG